jgi:glycolate oxidase
MRKSYTRIDEIILAALRTIAGAVNVSNSAEDREKYSRDEVAELRFEPEAIVKVASAQQVAAILRLAQQAGFPVTPRGAGQGLSGGSVPVYGGVVLSLEKMDRIIEIDEENLMVSVEPGVITGNLHRAVEALGLFYPPDPASLDSCSLGGNIAENAGGPRAVKYGVTRHYVCGLEAVLPSGEIATMGGKLVKDVTGYDLMQLLIGSEGTLAVVTKIILRLIPLPPVRVDLLVPFADFRAASRTVSAIISHRIVPTALEFMGKDSILAVEALTQKDVPHHEAEAHLLITLDGNDRQAVEQEYEKVGELCLAHGALDVIVADSPALRDKIWGARRLIIEALKHRSPQKIMDTADLVVPRARIPDLVEQIKAMSARHGMNIVCFGHSGDGNVHVNVIKDVAEEVWTAKRDQVAEEMYRIALSMGGAITGEHGIGLTRRKYLPLAVDQHQIEVMRRIKLAFDPHEILNPGKLFE